MAADLDCPAAFRKIARKCVARIKAHHGNACAGDAEAVHQTRVAITQLRATVSFFEPMTIDAEWRRLKREIAWLNTVLGAVRDGDVAASYASRKRYRAWARRMMGRDIDQRRIRDHRRLVRRLRSNRFESLIEAVSRWIERGPWFTLYVRNARPKAVASVQAHSKAKLNRWRQQLIRKGRRLGTLDASRRHRLRIKAKRLRYMLEALADIVGVHDCDDLRRLHRSASRLQQVLGDLRDLKRFASISAGSPPVEGRKHRKNQPPGYRRQKKKLLGAAIEAYRSLK